MHVLGNCLWRDYAILSRTYIRTCASCNSSHAGWLQVKDSSLLLDFVPKPSRHWSLHAVAIWSESEKICWHSWQVPCKERIVALVSKLTNTIWCPNVLYLCSCNYALSFLRNIIIYYGYKLFVLTNIYRCIQ